MPHDVYISVDVETSGPVPGEYSLLSIGACPVERPDQGFYVELQPDAPGEFPAALAVSGLDLARLRTEGTPLPEALHTFRTWVNEQAGTDGRPVFVGLNAAFDWSFINTAFHRYLGHNPFGFAALDIKSLYMGRFGTHWDDTRSSRMRLRFGLEQANAHHALADARLQAQLFGLIMRSSPEAL